MAATAVTNNMAFMVSVIRQKNIAYFWYISLIESSPIIANRSCTGIAKSKLLMVPGSKLAIEKRLFIGVLLSAFNVFINFCAGIRANTARAGAMKPT